MFFLLVKYFEHNVSSNVILVVEINYFFLKEAYEHPAHPQGNFPPICPIIQEVASGNRKAHNG